MKERGEEDRMKNRKEKERKKSGEYLKTKGSTYCVGTEPSAILYIYIGILVTSTTTGHDGSVVSALAYQAKGRGSIPSCGRAFFHKYFPSSLSNLCRVTN